LKFIIDGRGDLYSVFRSYAGHRASKIERFKSGVNRRDMQEVRDAMLAYITMKRSDILCPCLHCGNAPPVIVVDVSFKAAHKLCLRDGVEKATEEYIECEGLVELSVWRRPFLFFGGCKTLKASFNKNFPNKSPGAMAAQVRSTEHRKAKRTNEALVVLAVLP
jgi:hypothetical protein